MNILKKIIYSKRFTTFVYLNITLLLYKFRRKFGINHTDLRILGVARPALDYILRAYS